MIHNSTKIHHRGVQMFKSHMAEKNWIVEERPQEAVKLWMQMPSASSKKLEYYPVVVSVKPRTYAYETKVTGMNAHRIGKLKSAQENLHRGIYMVFVDAKEKQIYGNFLAVLTNKSAFDRGIKFPLDQHAGGQVIRYFSVLMQMNHLFDLTNNEAAELIRLHVTNGTNERQKTLF